MSSHPLALSQWGKEVSTHLPILSKTQVMVVAMYSLGMVLTSCCGITSVGYFLAEWLGKKNNTMRQRLREILYDKEDKRGEKRRDIDNEACFVYLLKWVLRWWESEERRIVLALDATTLGQRFTVLSISVLYRGCGVPVAWVILPAAKKGAWNPHWLRLLSKLSGAIPGGWLVLVLTDRGLYSKQLFKAMVKNGWHPMMRINAQGRYRPAGQYHFHELNELLTTPNSAWYGEVDCFITKQKRLRCTLMAHWDEGFAEPWLLLTDLPPQCTDVYWYAMRMWIEQGYKDYKRGGLHWEQTKMTKPERAARLWLIMSIATLWIVSVGGEADHALPASSLPDGLLVPPTKPRRLSCFRRGIIKIIVSLIQSSSLPFGRFLPEPWPRSPLNQAIVVLLSEGGYAVHY